MVFMLIRTALWGLAIILAGLVFVWLRDSDGGVTLALAGRAYGPFRLIEALAMVLLAALIIWLAVKAFSFIVALVRFLTGDETALSRFWNRSRERRGFDALAGGLISMAEGDGRTALTKARKAERLLDRPGLTQLLMAQSAEAAGDAGLAKDYYKRLASSPDTAFVGVKGLMDQALRADDKPRALKLASHAATLKPRDADALTALFALQCEVEDWEGARRTLESAVKAKAISRDVADRRAAVLMIADAQAAAKQGESAKARELAERARRTAPELIPAIIAVARNQASDGGQRRAEKTLRDAWRAEPHPDIAAAFAALAPDETPAERRARFTELTKSHPEDPETRLLTAELALADNDPPAARVALGKLVDTHPTARALALMAAVEKADGGDEALVRGWLARAVAAPRAAQWACANCGARHAEWAPVCRRCEAFDTLAWEDGEPQAGVDAVAALLPVIGGVEDEMEADDMSDDGLEADLAEAAPPEKDPAR